MTAYRYQMWDVRILIFDLSWTPISNIKHFTSYISNPTARYTAPYVAALTMTSPQPCCPTRHPELVSGSKDIPLLSILAKQWRCIDIRCEMWESWFLICPELSCLTSNILHRTSQIPWLDTPLLTSRNSLWPLRNPAQPVTLNLFQGLKTHRYSLYTR